MKKELKDYLHLYLGCECYFKLSQDENGWVAKMTTEDLHRYGGRLDWMKPILRPLSDMTEEERSVYHSLNKPYPASPVHSHLMVEHATFESFHYLLKQGFDLFGLIEAGLVIDKTKLNEKV